MTTAMLCAALLVAASGREALAQATPSLTFYGFVKAETIYDTRQVFNIREGQFHLYPLPDEPGNDVSNWLMTAIQTRAGVRGAAEALGARATGVIEGDFFGGPTNDNISLLILRLAYADLAWNNREARFGQDWSLLFAPLFPGTVSFNTGAPFQPFARQPQVRFTYRPGGVVTLVGALAGQRDAFSEIGGPKLQQQSGLPMALTQVRYEDERFVVGGSASAKRIRPLLVNEQTFNAGAVQAFARVRDGARWSVTAKATYGSDLVDHLMTGGFVGVFDPALGAVAYIPLDAATGWVDVEGAATERVRVGVFGGYLRNEGANEEIDRALLFPEGRMRAANLVDQWRISPRLIYSAGPIRFAAEVEVTSARYGAEYDDRFRPVAEGASRVTNLRGLFAAYYIF